MATSSAPRSEVPLAHGPRPTWRGVVAVLALLAVTFVAARSCQQDQIRIDQERAVQIARPAAGFDPARTQVRLVRQGLNGRPYWAVSFSAQDRVTTVRVDARTGTVAAVNRE